MSQYQALRSGRECFKSLKSTLVHKKSINQSKSRRNQ